MTVNQKDSIMNLNEILTACTLEGSASQALYISSMYWPELPLRKGSAAAGTLYFRHSIQVDVGGFFTSNHAANF